MHIVDYADTDFVALDLDVGNKEELLGQLVDLLVKQGRVAEPELLMSELLKRERVMSTGIGGGIVSGRDQIRDS